MFALPRGGVPVALEVARALHAPLDVLAVRKLGAPGIPSSASAPSPRTASACSTPRSPPGRHDARRTSTARWSGRSRELRRRMRAYRDGRPPLDVAGRTVDRRRRRPGDRPHRPRGRPGAARARRGRIVVAVPVGSPEAVALAARGGRRGRLPHDPAASWSASGAGTATSRGRRRGGARAARRRGPGGEPRSRAPSRAASCSTSARRLAGDLTVPAGAARPRALRARQRQQPAQPAQPRRRGGAQRRRLRDAAVRPADRARGRSRRELVFDIPLLAAGCSAVTRWALRGRRARAPADRLLRRLHRRRGGAPRGGRSSATSVSAVVSRGGRPDLAADRLAHVRAPTLLIVGRPRPEVLELNRRAAALLRCPHELVVVVEGAGHLFEEPGALETVARLAADWFDEHLRRRRRPGGDRAADHAERLARRPSTSGGRRRDPPATRTAADRRRRRLRRAARR